MRDARGLYAACTLVIGVSAKTTSSSSDTSVCTTTESVRYKMQMMHIMSNCNSPKQNKSRIVQSCWPLSVNGVAASIE
jgi:hypothetical protein